ncbi:MAG: hypothetical protein ACI9F9_002255, partial [Candidatus Paceibacteria bacterium]
METDFLIHNARIPARFLLATSLLAASACQASPPQAQFQGPVGLVRANKAVDAAQVSGLFEGLSAEVAALLPDVKNRAREVWVQATPALYRFSGNSYAEADGFWSESYGRIHLREDAQSLQRTLAHELVHASLGDSWDALPGTIEEGLCDVVSVLLCPEHASNMRTGRLSAAAFATGGLELEVQIFVPGEMSLSKLRIGTMSRVRLMANKPPTFDPCDVFTVEAGLSSTELPIDDKKALYGLSYLLVDRIVARRGFEGLHGLCLRADREGLDEVPSSWLLEAADMTGASTIDWRLALQDAIGTRELQTLVEIYPDLLEDSAARFLGRRALVAVDQTGTAPLSASVRVSGASAMLDLSLDVTA